MSRKGQKDHAERLVGLLTRDGARARARRILRAAMDETRRKISGALTSDQLLDTAVENAKPTIWIRTEHVGGQSYSVPTVASEKQAVAIAIRAILDTARRGQVRTMKRKLARALLAAFGGDVDPYERWTFLLEGERHA